MEKLLMTSDNNRHFLKDDENPRQKIYQKEKWYICEDLKLQSWA